MRSGTPHIGSLKRVLTMLEAVIADGGRTSIAALARQVDMPTATAHRQVTTLVAEGYLAPSSGGGYVAGRRLLGLLNILDEKQVVASIAAAVLHDLARRVRSVAQLGTLENDMVTYRIKIGHGASKLFTRVGMQLEAYCSGIGKVLIAHLPERERELYLATGPFIPLTENTIVEPEALAAELEKVKEQGFAIDNAEISPNLFCVAVPIRRSSGEVIAAISVSQNMTYRHRIPQDELLPMLLAAAETIERRG
ncbi:MAG: IclR family transcriptional regulator [Sphingomonadales bacterium]|nr:MAG: IclR family transcriptional regulator [Sphingomonadales bacterium]